MDASGRRSSLSYYGNHHGMGHVLIAYSTAPIALSQPGVMLDTATAIRDPIFYRWHRHVDDMCFRWQQTQPVNDFSDGPKVLLRQGLARDTLDAWSPDIILCYSDELPGVNDADFDGQRLGESALGIRTDGRNWNRELSSGEFTFLDGATEKTIRTTDELQTQFHTCEITLRNDTKETIKHLSLRDFSYFVRVQNLLPRVQEITVRIFLVPTTVREDRRMWIEMDKFRHRLERSDSAVIYRPSEKSSVVRKPVLKDPCAVPDPPADPTAEPDYYCTCGWPYHLLLPSGTPEGMDVTLMVMITDWEKDQVAEDSHCGSLSFCGAVDRYPDRRSMGYPFDRPFATSIANTIAMHPNMAVRPITIKRTGDA
jgi:hypothetical protein